MIDSAAVAGTGLRAARFVSLGKTVHCRQNRFEAQLFGGAICQGRTRSRQGEKSGCEEHIVQVKPADIRDRCWFGDVVVSSIECLAKQELRSEFVIYLRDFDIRNNVLSR